MLSALGGPGTLEELGQQAEDGRGEPARRRRLPGGQAHLPLRRGDTGHAVHGQQDVVTAVTEPLGDAGGGERGAQPHQGRLVRGRHDDDRAGQALRPEVALDELADLTATLAHQRQHTDRGVGAPDDHGQDARLADPGAGEDADPLSPAARHEGVEGSHAEAELGVDAAAPHGARRGALDPGGHDVAQWRAAVDGATESVDDPAQQAWPDRHRQWGTGGDDAVAAAHPPQVGDRHTGHEVVMEGDDLGEHRAPAAVQGHRLTHGQVEPRDVDAQPDRPDDLPVDRRRGGAGQQLEHGVHASTS